ncbi:MAG: hypothetical protein WC340_17450 [Kiritimatiellia bacterium]
MPLIERLLHPILADDDDGLRFKTPRLKKSSTIIVAAIVNQRRG